MFSLENGRSFEWPKRCVTGFQAMREILHIYNTVEVYYDVRNYRQ